MWRLPYGTRLLCCHAGGELRETKRSRLASNLGSNKISRLDYALTINHSLCVHLHFFCVHLHFFCVAMVERRQNERILASKDILWWKSQRIWCTQGQNPGSDWQRRTTHRKNTILARMNEKKHLFSKVWEMGESPPPLSRIALSSSRRTIGVSTPPLCDLSPSKSIPRLSRFTNLISLCCSYNWTLSKPKLPQQKGTENTTAIRRMTSWRKYLIWKLN